MQNHSAPSPAFMVIESHALCRLSLMTLLRSAFSHWTGHECESLAGALSAKAKAAAPIDLVALGLDLRTEAGVHAMHRTREAFPAAKLIALSPIDNVQEIRLAFQGGADGLIDKGEAPPAIITAIEGIARGQTKLSAGLSKAMLPEAIPDALARYRLSPRQEAVLEQLMAGKATKEIARALELSPSTVKVHLSAIFQKMGVRSRVGAIALVARRQKAA